MPRRGWVVLPALGVPTLGALVYFLWLPGGAAAQAVYTLTKLFTLIWPLTVFALPGEALRWPRGRRGDLAALPLGALTGAAIALALFVGMLTPLGEVVRASAGDIRAKADALGILDHYWAFALFLAVVHSGLEEYYWRWFVFGQLRRLLPLRAAHLLAAAAFAAHHVVVAGVFFGWGWAVVGGVVVATGGLIWSGLYQRQGSLAGAWLSHALVDLALMAIGYRLIFSDATLG